MKPIQAPGEPRVAVYSLLAGALGAPTFYVVAAIVAPRGFADLHGEGALVAPIYFLVGWAWSAALTLMVGGTLWLLLHRRGWDGFITYVGAAVAAALGLTLLLTGDLSRWDMLGMAALNGCAVRLVELRLRSQSPVHKL